MATKSSKKAAEAGDETPQKSAVAEPQVDLPQEVETAAAAPLTPPAPSPVVPQAGNTAQGPQAVVRTAPGPHLQLLDDEGNAVDPDDLFYPQEGPAAVLRVKRRVYQEFRYPGTRTPVRQLLLHGGTVKPLREAMQLVAELKAATAENAANAVPEGPEQAAI